MLLIFAYEVIPCVYSTRCPRDGTSVLESSNTVPPQDPSRDIFGSACSGSVAQNLNRTHTPKNIFEWKERPRMTSSHSNQSNRLREVKTRPEPQVLECEAVTLVLPQVICAPQYKHFIHACDVIVLAINLLHSLPWRLIYCIVSRTRTNSVKHKICLRLLIVWVEALTVQILVMPAPK